MKSILPPIGLIDRLVGKQHVKGGTRFRKTSLCLTIPVSEGTLLYHTLRGTMVLLSPGETPEDCFDELMKEWFFVPEEFRELDESLNLKETARLLQRSSRKTGFTIMTTTDCNARCFYCYELGRSRIPMSEKTAHDVASYIRKTSCGQYVNLQWFGGEPLYNRRAIEVITDDLRSFGVPFTSSMVTNGYYLDRSTVDTAVREWNLTRVQITLDGTRETYSAVKRYVDDRGAVSHTSEEGNECTSCENRQTDGDAHVFSAYDRVIENIGAVSDAGVEVHIRLNMDRSNAKDLNALADELSARFGGRNRFYVYVKLLSEFAGKIHSFESEEEALAEYFALSKKLEQYGFKKVAKLTRTLRLNTCMADNDARDLIAPDGHVGRCEHFSESEFTGTIYDEKRDETVAASWKELFDPLSECTSCPLFPDCNQLKKCDWNRNGCTRADREIRLAALKDKIIATYESVKNGTVSEADHEET